MRTGLARVVRLSLWERTPRDHRQEPGAFRRRQVVCAVVIVLGAAVLGWSLRIAPGSPLFYPATLLLAATWTVGAFASGPLHLGRAGSAPERELRRPVVGPVVLGLLLAAGFTGAALLLRDVAVVAGPVRDVLRYATRGSAVLVPVVTVVNGLAEELFFRGALYAAVPRHPVAVTAVVYALTTAATGNPMLLLAALVLGVLVGLERRATGGVLAPALTHVTWSVAMLYALPWAVSP
jgi:hypothetical protein